MSDTVDEIRDHLGPIRRATGKCLVNGLGLGMVLQGMLNKPEVEHVTAIEISPDVIALVAPHYQERFGDRLTIIQADALVWRPSKGTRFNVVWHDIWDDMSEDNLPDMHKLHRSYGRRCDWQGSWGRDIIEANHRRNSYW
jgi:spermidine synthase